MGLYKIVLGSIFDYLLYQEGGRGGSNGPISLLSPLRRIKLNDITHIWCSIDYTPCLQRGLLRPISSEKWSKNHILFLVQGDLRGLGPYLYITSILVSINYPPTISPKPPWLGEFESKKWFFVTLIFMCLMSRDSTFSDFSKVIGVTPWYVIYHRRWGWMGKSLNAIWVPQVSSPRW